MKTHHLTRCLVMAALAAASTLSIAQDEPEAAPAAPLAYDEVWEAWSPTWSTQAIEKAAKAITGAWRTKTAVSEFGGDAGGSIEMLMTIHPAPVSGVADALYVEQYRADNPSRPFRQSVMQFYPYKNGVRLRTYEIMRDETGKGVLAAMGMVPEAFPTLSRDELLATLDLDIEMAGSGFKGRTPYPYPTGTGGAVEMTSTITVAGETMQTADLGYAADGSVVWGAGEDATYEWTRTEPWAKVEKRQGGLALINLAAGSGEAPVNGGRVFVHYTGWTAEGNKFDSSRDKGQPWPLTWPVSEMRVIDGWKQGFDGILQGTVRKLIIPAALAYGDRGVPRANIGPNATLYFDAEVMAVQAPEPAPEGEAPAQPADE